LRNPVLLQRCRFGTTELPANPQGHRVGRRAEIGIVVGQRTARQAADNAAPQPQVGAEVVVAVFEAHGPPMSDRPIDAAAKKPARSPVVSPLFDVGGDGRQRFGSLNIAGGFSERPVENIKNYSLTLDGRWPSAPTASSTSRRASKCRRSACRDQQLCVRQTSI
jgi:hypothetical protein